MLLRPSFKSVSNASLPQLFVNYGSIFFLLGSLPVAFLLDRPNGIRAAVVLSSACNLIGCVLRLLARSTSVYSLAFLHASYIVNAFGGPGHLIKSKSQPFFFNKRPSCHICPISPLQLLVPRLRARPRNWYRRGMQHLRARVLLCHRSNHGSCTGIRQLDELHVLNAHTPPPVHA
jgi:hypothetical protein